MPSIAGTRVALIGAGAVNFGGAEGPWDHASRLEKLGAVIAVVDPLVAKAQEKIDERRANKEFAHVWANTEVYADIQDMLDNVKPSAVFIGVPPSFHGCYKYPLELQVLRAGAHLFLEKPLSNAPVDEVTKYAAEVERCAKRRNWVSVGYMFRYSLFGEKIKELLKGKKPVCLMARYNCTYANIPSPFWWNSSTAAAPSRSVKASLTPGDIGYLENACDETAVPPENLYRVHTLPTGTSRAAHSKSGARCSAAGEAYDASVLQGDSDEEVTFEFSGDDMYLTEDREFLKADAVNTYALTCKIRDVALAN
ncbi:NAD(P)-binding domain [Phytophthora cactorum]|nr:NAD(P)-binding domain [Phytophthora cactorum]